MALTLSGQKPATLQPEHLIPINGTYDPMKAIRKTIIKPLMKPITKGRAVSITDSTGATLNKDAVLDLFMRCVGGTTIDVQAETEMKSLLQQGLIHFDYQTPLSVNELFTIQAGASKGLPYPSNMPGRQVIYTANHDVIPAAKAHLSGNDPELLLASIAYTYTPEALGFWFRTSDDFDDFTTWLDTEIQTLSPVLPGDTVNLLTKFRQTNLKSLVEGYLLRTDDTDGNDEYSFARVIVNLLMKYQKVANQGANQPPVGVLPFSVSELFLPRTILIMNVEAHARATPQRVEKEWRIVKSALTAKVRVISNTSLSKLAALPRALAKVSAKAANAQSNKSAQAGRSAKIVFRKQAPTKVELESGLLRVLKRMKQVNRSQNALKMVKTTFTKANRRDPLDFNRPGKMTSTKYLPDLHIYIDTSGSISEENYQQAVLMLIKMAKKMNVDLYFNSFSHVMSQEILLRTKNKSVAKIWQEFRRIPKVSGGTDFKQIWDYINASPTRQRRLSLAVTDFEWEPSMQRDKHPTNLYYAPCSSMDWDRIVYWAGNYSKSMRHIEPAIAQHFIGVIV